MKKIILVLSLFALNSNAESYHAQCVGNGGKVMLSIDSTADQSNKKIIFNYENAMGADDFPLYEGVVTKLALPVINKAQKDLKNLGEKVTVSFPMEKCKFSETDAFMMECLGEGEFLSPTKTNLKSYTISISKVHEESLNHAFDTIKVRWGVDTPDFHYSLALPFDPAMCEATYKK